MNINGHHIKLTTNHSPVLMGVVVKIQRHVKKGWRFALSTADGLQCVVYQPSSLSAGYSTGEFVRFIDRETFINCIQLALYEYTEFTSLHVPQVKDTKMIQL